MQVGAYDPRDPLLDEVWGQLADAQVPVVVHCGGGPVPGPYTGPGPFGEVLARHPRLTAVVAHLGMPEYARVPRPGRRYERVHLDTTMAFTDFTEQRMPFPRELLPAAGRPAGPGRAGQRLPEHAVPVRCTSSRRWPRLDLGDDWLRAVLHDNGARLLGLDAA